MAPLLENQYETDLYAEDLIECRYKAATDKSIAYKIDDKEIKYYAVNLAIIRDILLALIVENTPDNLV